MAADNWSQKFTNGLFRESDGTPSFARIGSLMVLLASLFWVSHVVIHDHKLPELGSITTFTTTSLLSLYGTNKLSSTVSSIASSLNSKQ